MKGKERDGWKERKRDSNLYLFTEDRKEAYHIEHVRKSMSGRGFYFLFFKVGGLVG